MMKSIAALLLTLTPAFAAPKKAAPKIPLDPVLDQPIKRFESTEDRQIEDLCEKISIPCGIEDRYEDDFRKKADPVTFKNTTPRKILEEVVKKHPAYAWALSGGMIHFGYVNPKGFDNPLDRKIGPLTMAERPSSQAALDVLRVAGIRAGFSWTGKPVYGKAALKVDSTTARAALDAVVKADGKAAWLLIVSSGTPNGFELRTWNVAPKEAAPAAPAPKPKPKSGKKKHQ